MHREVGGISGLLVLIADVRAILDIVQSSADILKKVLWILLVLPLLGFMIWFLPVRVVTELDPP